MSERLNGKINIEASTEAIEKTNRWSKKAVEDFKETSDVAGLLEDALTIKEAVSSVFTTYLPVSVVDRLASDHKEGLARIVEYGKLEGIEPGPQYVGEKFHAYSVLAQILESYATTSRG